MTFLPILLMILVWFDGVPTSCLVDTGATATIITQRVAASIGTLGPELGQDSLRAANQQLLPIRWHRVANVGTRYLGWSDGVIAVVPENLPGIECILGTDFLGRQPIRIDWTTQQVYPG